MTQNFNYAVKFDEDDIKFCTLVLSCKPILHLTQTAVSEISNQLGKKGLKSETQFTDGREQSTDSFSDPSIGVTFFTSNSSLGTDGIYESILCLPETLSIITSNLNKTQCKYQTSSGGTTMIKGKSVNITKIVPAPDQLDANEKKQFVDDIMKSANLASFKLDTLRVNLSALRLPTQNDKPNEASLLQAIDSLPQKEKQMMQLRFGLNGKEKHLPKEIATLMRVSEASVLRLEKRVMEKLKQNS